MQLPTKQSYIVRLWLGSEVHLAGREMHDEWLNCLKISSHWLKPHDNFSRVLPCTFSIQMLYSHNMWTGSQRYDLQPTIHVGPTMNITTTQSRSKWSLMDLRKEIKGGKGWLPVLIQCSNLVVGSSNPLDFGNGHTNGGPYQMWVYDHLIIMCSKCAESKARKCGGVSRI